MPISLAAEPVFHIGSFPVYNSLLTSLLVTLFLIIIAIKVHRTKPDPSNRFYNFIEMLVEGFLKAIESITGPGKVARQMLPIIPTFFLLIILSNWSGILPGVGSIGFWEEHHAEAAAESESTHAEAPVDNHEATEVSPEHAEETPVHTEESSAPHEPELVFVPLFRAPYSDLNLTLALAIVSVLFVQYMGLKNLGTKYLKKFFNFTNPIMLFVGLLELISDVVKIFSFAFRLFGNIFAGEVLLIVMFTLVPFIMPIPFLGIELFAGFIQALIFSMLSVVFINTAVHEH